MAKVPANRHSKQTKDPVTIDLSAEKPSEDKTPASPSPQLATIKDGLKPTEKPVPVAPSASETPKTDPKSAKIEAETPETPKSLPQDKASTLKPSVTTPSTGFAKTTSSASSTASGGANVPPASKPATAGKSGGGGFGAGLTGALIALLLAGGAYYSGILPERSSGNAAVTAEQVDAINARLAAVEEQNSAPAQDVQGLNEAVAQLRTQVQSLSEQASAGDEASVVPADLDQRLAQIETRLGEAVQNQSASPEVQAQVDALSNQLQTANQSIADLIQQIQEQSDQPQAALVLAASQLRDAVTRGGDISAAVTGFAALGGPSADVDALKALGSTPVPSQEEIAAQAESAYAAMLAEAQKPAADAGVVDRLAASARALVSVRPVGPMEGDGVPETVSRMEAAVKANNLDAALGELQKLPANIQAAGQTFADLLVARRDALARVSAASAAALGTAGGAQ